LCVGRRAPLNAGSRYHIRAAIAALGHNGRSQHFEVCGAGHLGLQQAGAIITVIGDYSVEEFRAALEESAASEFFRPGTAILFDGRASFGYFSREEIRDRADRVAALVKRGLAPRVALVIRDEPLRVGKARIMADRLVELELQSATFYDPAEATQWLRAGAMSVGGG
jgi:hypothetical protein